jgi:hypothetical protein
MKDEEAREAIRVRLLKFLQKPKKAKRKMKQEEPKPKPKPKPKKKAKRKTKRKPKQETSHDPVEVTAFGLYPSCSSQHDEKKPPSEAEVELCEKWISLFCSKRQSGIRKDLSSYYLKHRVEEWLRTQGDYSYIGNGAFIKAAIREGYVFKPSFKNSPNALFDMDFSKEAFPR